MHKWKKKYAAVLCSLGSPPQPADRSPKIAVFTGVVGVAVSNILNSVRSFLVSLRM